MDNEEEEIEEDYTSLSSSKSDDGGKYSSSEGIVSMLVLEDASSHVLDVIHDENWRHLKAKSMSLRISWNL